jgi:diadenosine tetraphosphate (Ap4A) HIT family hydrolase
MTESKSSCPLCLGSDGELLWRNDLCHAVLINEASYPGFCRVITNRHVREMTDLPESDRMRLFEVVMAVEEAIRHILSPDKVNLASLGNVVPHLHWHVIPRYLDDPHFPAPIWAEARRTVTSRVVPENLGALLKIEMAKRLS